jgi:hypothetical protein
VTRGEVRPAQGIAWVVEQYGVTIYCRDRGPLVSIAYPYAGLWALIADGTYASTRARDVLALLAGMDEGTAARQAARALSAWRTLGLLEGE